MVSCADFIESYSDYRDGILFGEALEAASSHLKLCASCQRYDRVMMGGVDTLRSNPRLELSDDFKGRLQYRLYDLDSKRSASGATSGASAAALVALLAAIGLAAWVPLVRSSPTIQLPAVTVAPPIEAPESPTLFTTGPLLIRVAEPVLVSTTARSDLFTGYASLGKHVADKQVSTFR